MIGLALAAAGLLEERAEAAKVPEEVAAYVGERTIRRVDYQRVLAGVESDLRNPVDDALRKRVLERMVDEELLVQRALDLGLAVVDRRVRGELTSGLIDSIVSEADARSLSPAEIEEHYAANIEFFTRPGRLRAETLLFADRPVSSGAEADGEPALSPERRAEEAAQRLRALAPGDRAGVARIGERWATPQISPAPDTLLPASKLRDYVGPTVLKALGDLEVGIWSEPIATGGGWVLARLLAREPAVVPPLGEVENLVRQDLKRRRGDEALGDYLRQLRAEIPVRINEAMFVGGEPQA